MRNKNNFLSENDVYFSLEADFYIEFNAIIKLHFAPFGGRKCVLERPLCGA